MNSYHPSQAVLPQSRAAHCWASCRKLIAQIAQAKAAILSQFRQSVQTHEHLLELALNEAEGLAWQTGYPHLVFPGLALEKAGAVAEWHARQRSIQHRPQLAEAA